MKTTIAKTISVKEILSTPNKETCLKCNNEIIEVGMFKGYCFDCAPNLIDFDWSLALELRKQKQIKNGTFNPAWERNSASQESSDRLNEYQKSKLNNGDLP